MLHQVYQFGLRPLLLSLDPELSHQVAIEFCRRISNSSSLRSIVHKFCAYEDPRLHQKLWGIDFPNPVGLAAGFDKDAIAVGAWSSLGFGFAEVGTITAQPQPGNPKPRLFRLPNDRAVLNRMGFNNHGAEAISIELKADLDRHPLSSPLGINLGKSKITPLEDAWKDYASSFKLLRELGDYFVVNVSSPNTPGLRDLQNTQQLAAILAAIQTENIEHKPILVKIAPDLHNDDVIQVVNTCISHQVAGMIATNTTISRDRLTTKILPVTGNPLSEEAGGISGKPLSNRSTEVIRLIWQATNGKLPIIGVGGIFSADDAWDKITAGASLIQIYTGLIYQGPFVVPQILKGLVQKLDRHGLNDISQAVGIKG